MVDEWLIRGYSYSCSSIFWGGSLIVYVAFGCGKPFIEGLQKISKKMYTP